MSIPWMKILKYGLPVLILGLFLWGIYSLGSSNGKAVIQAKWDKAELDRKSSEVERQKQIDTKQTEHGTKSQEISNDLSELEKIHQSAINLIVSDSDKRLRISEQRAEVFKSMSEASATDRERLANHATKLDQLLSESLGILEEGRVLVELRDGQIRGLAAQINIDRQLISGQSNANVEDQRVSTQ